MMDSETVADVHRDEVSAERIRIYRRALLIACNGNMGKFFRAMFKAEHEYFSKPENQICSPPPDRICDCGSMNSSDCLNLPNARHCGKAQEERG